MELDLLFDNLGEAVSSVSIAKLLLLESKWTLQCLASMGEYQETLASATHTGALDTVLHILTCRSAAFAVNFRLHVGHP